MWLDCWFVWLEFMLFECLLNWFGYTPTFKPRYFTCNCKLKNINYLNIIYARGVELLIRAMEFNVDKGKGGFGRSRKGAVSLALYCQTAERRCRNTNIYSMAPTAGRFCQSFFRLILCDFYCNGFSAAMYTPNNCFNV